MKTDHFPAWTETLLRQAQEAEQSEGALYDELVAAIAPAIRSPHHAVLLFVASAHELASVMLRSPHDYPPHALDLATGILSEALVFVQADKAPTWD